MKSLLPWFYLITLSGSQAVYAAVAAQSGDGLIDYRQGEYFHAAQALNKANAANNALADYYIGKMRLYGFGLLKNNTLALRYLTQAGDQGVLPAQQWLARYYLSNQQADLALNWFKKAANQGDEQAQMYMIAANLIGYGTHKNPDAARKYIIDGARAGNPVAQYIWGMDFFSSRDMRSRKMGILWLNKAADQGNVNAQYQLGLVYSQGKIVPSDVAMAQSFLEKAANQNDIKAQFALAQLYLDPKNKLDNTKIAIEWMQKAATQGSIEAQQALATLYQEGKIVPADPALAEKWQAEAKKSLAAAANAQAPDARKEVALWLSDGKTQDFEKTSYGLGGIFSAWKNPTALQENNYNPSPKMRRVTRQDLYKPAFVLAQPKEIPINDYFDFLSPTLSGNEAGHWYFPIYPIDSQIQALEDSHSLVLQPAPWCSVVDDGRTYPHYIIAPTNYFGAFTSGWKRQANYQQVLTYLYQRAILGDADAQFKLGQLYEYGIVLNKNIPQAIIYYELAALQQDVRAEYNLGVLYLEGKTDPVDYQKGLDWIMDAAFKGNDYAQYALANIYDNGLTDPQGVSILSANHQQALAMYYLASANHYNKAQFKLAESLTRENNGVLSVSARQNRTNLVHKLYQEAAKSGVVEAILPAAFYEAMDPDVARQQHAFSVAKEKADTGNALAALLLGMMYERGIGTPANEEEAIHWYQEASVNPVSEFILGTYMLQGTGISQDKEKGRALLQQAADAGFSYANYNLAIVKKDLNETFLPDLDKARQAGNSKAGLLLADFYLLQANDPDKMQQARDIYQHFADKGDRNAQLKLAFLYDRGLGGQVDPVLAGQWYTLSAKQGQPVAQYLLGLMYQLGKLGGLPDYAQSKKWYGMASNVYAPAADALGFVLDTVDDNYNTAASHYEFAANHGDAIGQYNLGLIYEEGKGQPVDQVKAEKLYTASAEQGYSPAMTQLAGLYFRGINGQKDEEKALDLYKKSAVLGNREANYQLGLLSETGVGMTLDFASAVRYYQHAADAGDEKAALALARMYQYGVGVPKDISHATEIYRQLAARNNAYAQYQLAVFYADGVFGQPMPDESKRLLLLASANGSVQAKNRLSCLAAQQEQRISFIQPVMLNGDNAPEMTEQAADLMYLDALNEWNRGDEMMSRSILNRLVKEFPHYVPAKKIIEQLQSV